MSRNYYEKINEILIKYKKEFENKSNTFIRGRSILDPDLCLEPKIKSCELLLKIIDDKNDDEFNIFFTKHMSNIKFRKLYIYSSENRSINTFDSYKNVDEFISIFINVYDHKYYKELEEFLYKYIKLNEVLKKEELEKLELIRKEKEQLELIRKEKEELELLKKEINKKSKPIKTDTKKKKTISATIKKLVWNTNIGEEIGKFKCLCCNSTDITQLSFNCGHIIAEANGGKTIVSNLKPICQNCNSSMGTKNMNEFMNSLK